MKEETYTLRAQLSRLIEQNNFIHKDYSNQIEQYIKKLENQKANADDNILHLTTKYKDYQFKYEEIEE